MEKAIIIRYGEIGIKSSWVRREFEDRLIDNISRALVNNNVEIEKVVKIGGRIYIWCSDIKKSLNILKNVFGIVSYSPAKIIKSDLDEMKKEALKMYKKLCSKKKKSFRVTTRRRYKDFPMTSMEISSEVGAHIVKNTNADVDLTEYDINVCFEINENETFVFSEFHEGYGGLPIGTQGKVLCVMTNKKECQKNAFLMARRGCELILAGKKEYLNFVDDFEKKYYHFKRDLETFEIKEFNLDEIIKIAKKTHAKAIVLQKKYLNKFENKTDLLILYPNFGF